MVMELQAALKLTDQFTNPLRNAVRMMDNMERVVSQVSGNFDNMTRSIQQAAEQMNTIGNNANDSTADIERLEQEMEQMRQELDRATREAGDLENNLGDAGNAGAGAGDKIGGAFKVAAGIIATVLAVDQIKDFLVNTTTGFIEFDDAVRKAGAISQATQDQFNSLKDSSIELGASTSKNATEVANAYAELAAKGFSIPDSIAAMPGIISASEASAEDLALASDTVSSALNIWGLEASNSGHVADVLAQSANQSAASIGDLGYAFKYAGAPAAALGIDMEEVAAAVGIMTDAGLDGSGAGTSLRASLLALLNPAKAQTKIMDNLGFSMMDSGGEAKSLSQIVGDLAESTKGMADADRVATVAKLVGTEAVSGFLTLMDAGPSTIDKMTDSLVKSDGAAKATADQMMGGIGGAVEQLGGTLDSFKLKIGDAFEEPVKNMAVWLAAVDTAEITAGIQSFVNYLVETFGPMVKLITEDIAAFKDSFMASAESGSLFYVMQEFQEGMHWIADNWEGIKDGIVALTAGFAAYNIVLAGGMILGPLNTLIRLYNTGMLATAIQVKATAAAQWLLNTAMKANPIGMVATAIGLLVAGGVALYQNWDTVRAKTEALWDKLGAFQGVATAVLGPLGFIIKAAVTMADEWDSTRSVWENVWGGIVSAAESSVNSVVESINWLIETINKIPGVNVPIIPKVNWTGVDMTQSSRMVGEMSYAEAANGSHYHGLDNVPYDSYRAVLHKGEKILDRDEAKRYRSGQTGGGVVINMNGVTIREEADVNKLANQLAAKIMEAGELGA